MGYFKFFQVFILFALVMWGCGKRGQKAVVETPEKDTLPAGYEDSLFKRTDIRNSDLRLLVHARIKAADHQNLFSSNKANFSNELKKFYERRNYRIAWLNVEKPRSVTQSFLEYIGELDQHGLDPNNYHIRELIAGIHGLYEKEDTPLMPSDLVQLDFELSATFITLCDHLLNGRYNSKNYDSAWVYYPEELNWEAYLQHAITTGNITAALEDLHPEDYHYEGLKEMLKKYRDLKSRGGWPKIPGDFFAKNGDSSYGIWLVKNRLAITGDLDGSHLHTPDSMKYNDGLERAVKFFQGRHGLNVDGVIGPSTNVAMNKPVEYRVDQIILNMERLRWKPNKRSNDYFLINIPDFRLSHISGGKEALAMNVIVGKSAQPTPVFSDTVNHIVFSPTWTVPNSIAREEMLPKIRSDSTFLSRNNYKLYANWDPNAHPINPDSIDWQQISPSKFNFRIVQQPGAYNTLGRVKFMFPNRFSVYMHDTPADHLFSRNERNLSHGCVRLQEPVKLAHYLLEKENLSYEKIDEYLKKEEPYSVVLNEKIPVHIIYRTAWMDENGTFHFRKDVYGYDRTQIRSMKLGKKQL